MRILDLILGNFEKRKREALIRANKSMSEKEQAEECNKELYSWLRDRNKKGLGVPVK